MYPEFLELVVLLPIKLPTETRRREFRDDVLHPVMYLAEAADNNPPQK